MGIFKDTDDNKIINNNILLFGLIIIAILEL